MKIIIGSDHRGYALKEAIKSQLQDIEWIDVGTNNGEERADYPVFAKKVAQGVLAKEGDLGIVICGSGVGVSIAANRFPKIYTALCWNEAVAKAAREHDHANILALPADYISQQEALVIIAAWLDATCLDGRFERRLQMIDE